MFIYIMIIQVCWWVIFDKVVDDLKFDVVYLVGVVYGVEYIVIGLLLMYLLCD